MSLALEQGVALVITGAQGCGKTTLAEAVARRHGAFANAVGDLQGYFSGLSIVPAPTIILDEPKDWSSLKPYIASRKVRIRRRGLDDIEANTPFIIITTCDVPPEVHDSRRFKVCTISFN